MDKTVYNRAYYRKHRNQLRAATRAYRKKNHREVVARDRARYAAKIEIRRAASRAYYHAHKAACQARARRYAKTHPGAWRKHLLKKKYGMTPEEYDALLKMQKGRCAVCRKKHNISGRRLFVDHDHKTKRVRGLLCYACNTAAGMLKDSPKLAKKLEGYLSDH